MTPKRLKQLASNPNHIPGVYNYCDRWCERCPLSSRCLNYAMELEEMTGDTAERDLQNEKFWATMHNNFELTLELLAQDCKEHGLDFEEIRREANSQAAIDAEEAHRRRRNEHPLVVSATRYMDRVGQWFKSHESALADKGEELAGRLRRRV